MDLCTSGALKLRDTAASQLLLITGTIREQLVIDLEESFDDDVTSNENAGRTKGLKPSDGIGATPAFETQ